MIDKEVTEEATPAETVEDTSSSSGEEDTGGEDTTDEKVDETPEDKIVRLEKTNKQLHARLRKKPGVEEKPQPIKKINQSDYLEERLELIASGVNKDLIKEAMVQAKDKEISLDEALKLPIVVSYQATLEAQKKSDDAGLGASANSKVAQEESSFKPGQTREDHKKAWAEANK